MSKACFYMIYNKNQIEMVPTSYAHKTFVVWKYIKNETVRSTWLSLGLLRPDCNSPYLKKKP